MNSILNPEAPEFYPHLSTMTQVCNLLTKHVVNFTLYHSTTHAFIDLATKYRRWLEGHARGKFCTVLRVDEKRSGQNQNWSNYEAVLSSSGQIKKLSYAEGGYIVVNKTIRSCNNMPSGPSYELFKTFTDFNVVTYQLSENVIVQENQIITAELPTVKLKRNDDIGNIEKIECVNDSLLDRVNINLDSASGVNGSSERFTESVASANATSEPVTLQVDSATFIGAKNIPRPQLAFKDTIDNSESLWVPKIADKPNSIKPLALNILYEDGVAVGYEHPYLAELEQYSPPGYALTEWSAPAAPPALLPASPYTFVDTAEALDRLVEHLNTVSEIAVDLEHHSYRTYQGITCLIQITTDEGGDFIVDTLAVREHVHKLNQVFTDPSKMKVLHGAEMDVLWLQRDFGVYLVGLFDTHQAAIALRLPGLSLKYLLNKYCNVNADKKYQLADWRIRPLPAELVQYARQDTHYLLYIYRRMRNELLALRAGDSLLRAVYEQSRQICGTTYKKAVLDERSHLRLYLRSKKSFDSRQMAALRLLYKWRDSHARELDESPMYLVPNHMLVTLAETLPREMQGALACCHPTPPFVKQHLVAMHRIILSCRELPARPELYQTPTPLRTDRTNKHQVQLHDLEYLPDCREDGVDVSVGWAPPASPPAPRPAPRPDVPAFTAPPSAQTCSSSGLNVDAQLFIPPFDRYRKYRALAQLEELKEFKEKEAKIGAISKGNELIQQEVLLKIQQAKIKAEEQHQQQQIDHQPIKIKQEPIKQELIKQEPIEQELIKQEPIEQELIKQEPPESPPPSAPPAEKRKRKMSDKTERRDDMRPQHKTKNNNHDNNENNKTSEWEDTAPNSAVKPFHYKNINYKKFFDAEKARKQPKMKSKKHK